MLYRCATLPAGPTCTIEPSRWAVRSTIREPEHHSNPQIQRVDTAGRFLGSRNIVYVLGQSRPHNERSCVSCSFLEGRCQTLAVMEGQIPCHSVRTHRSVLQANCWLTAYSEGHSQHWGVVSSFRVEIFGACLAVVAFMAIIVTLAIHQDRPLPQWPHMISINALIAIFTGVFRFSLLIPVAEGIQTRL